MGGGGGGGPPMPGLSGGRGGRPPVLGRPMGEAMRDEFPGPRAVGGGGGSGPAHKQEMTVWRKEIRRLDCIYE